MKIVENALEIANEVEYEKPFYNHNMPNWMKLMVYEDSDWNSLHSLRNKYLKEMPQWGLNKEVYEKAVQGDGYLSYEFTPCNFVANVIAELSHRKQEKKKREIRVMCDNAFVSIKNAVIIYNHIFKPIMQLNENELNLQKQLEFMNRDRDRVSAVLTLIKENNGNLQYVANELVAG